MAKNDKSRPFRFTRVSGRIGGAHFHNTVLGSYGPPIAVHGDKVDVQLRSDISEQPASKKSSGWTPALDRMRRLPVYCPECKAIFPSRTFTIIANSAHVWPSTETCVNCGYPNAKLSEGVFKITEEAITIISAPDLSREVLAKFQEILVKASIGDLDIADAIKEAETLDARLGGILGRAVTFGISGLAVLIAAISLGFQIYAIKGLNKFNDDLLAAVSHLNYTSDAIADALREMNDDQRVDEERKSPSNHEAAAKAASDQFKAQGKPES